MGSAEIAQTFTNLLEIYSRYEFAKFAFEADVKSYDFSFQSNTATESKRMNELNFIATYRWMLLGIAMQDAPLFKNSAGVIKLAKLTTTYLRLGIEKSWALPVIKKSNIKLTAFLGYPLGSSADNSDVEITSTSGLSFTTKFTLTRELLHKKNYSLHLTWPTFFNYQDQTTTLIWGTTSGSNKSTLWSAGTKLGVELQF
jgi:hypothetical protein